MAIDESVIGQVLTLTQRNRIFGWFFVIVGVGVVALDIGMAKPMVWPLGVFCVGIGWAIGIGGSRSQQIVLHDDAIEIVESGNRIPYAEVQGVCYGRRPALSQSDPKHDPLCLLAPGHSATIAAGGEFSARDVAGFVLRRVPNRGTRAGINLYEFHESQVQKFGEDRVFAYGPRTAPPPPLPASTAGKMALVFLLSAVVWIVFSVSQREPGWGVGGGFLVFFALIAGLVAVGHRNPNRRMEGGNAGLVIGPEGLALEQGALKGKLMWDEIRELGARASTQHLRLTREAPGVQLKVDGAVVNILDVFDRPLAKIAEVIDGYATAPA